MISQMCPSGSAYARLYMKPMSCASRVSVPPASIPDYLALVGDSAETLRALMPYLERKTDRSWQERIAKDVQHWWQLLEARAMNSADPVNPQRVF